jgi:hypothetical protein
VCDQENLVNEVLAHWGRGGGAVAPNKNNSLKCPKIDGPANVESLQDEISNIKFHWEVQFFLLVAISVMQNT